MLLPLACCVVALLLYYCRIPTQAPVWSVAWSRSHDQQLLLGLDKGRVAMVDLRMTGSRALVFRSGQPITTTSSSSTMGPAGAMGWPAAAGRAAGAAPPPPSQPWHSLLMLPDSWKQQHAAAAAAGEGCMAPDALLACPGALLCSRASLWLHARVLHACRVCWCCVVLMA